MSIDTIREIENNLRASGRTTRLIDYYVQELFKNKYADIEIRDHNKGRMSALYLMDNIVNRIKSEHPRVAVMSNNVNCTLKLMS